MATPRRTRFYLLPYRLLTRRWRIPAFLLIPAGVGLYASAPHLLPHRDYAGPLALGVSLVGLLIFLYTWLAHHAQVTFERDHFTVRTPFYAVAFSYRRVELVRSVEFGDLVPAKKAKAADWRIYASLWGKTVPTVTLKAYPLPTWWLKLWFHPYLFHPKEVGLVLPVEDWMAFTRRLDTARTRHG